MLMLGACIGHHPAVQACVAQVQTFCVHHMLHIMPSRADVIALGPLEQILSEMP